MDKRGGQKGNETRIDFWDLRNVDVFLRGIVRMCSHFVKYCQFLSFFVDFCHFLPILSFFVNFLSIFVNLSVCQFCQFRQNFVNYIQNESIYFPRARFRYRTTQRIPNSSVPSAKTSILRTFGIDTSVFKSIKFERFSL